ncbi:hypothetical protein VTI74DRAFT_946 [Chaetomium olivicolor]
MDENAKRKLVDAKEKCKTALIAAHDRGEISLWDLQYEWDVLLKCGETAWRVHHNVLCCASDYFKERLPLRVPSGAYVIMDFSSHCPRQLGTALKYIYTKNYDGTLCLNSDLSGECFRHLVFMYISGASVKCLSMMDDAISALRQTTFKLVTFLSQTPLQTLRGLDLSHLHQPLCNALVIMFEQGNRRILIKLRAAMAQLIDETMLWLIHNDGFRHAFGMTWVPWLWPHILEDNRFFFGQTSAAKDKQPQDLKTGKIELYSQKRHKRHNRRHSDASSQALKQGPKIASLNRGRDKVLGVHVGNTAAVHSTFGSLNNKNEAVPSTSRTNKSITAATDPYTANRGGSVTPDTPTRMPTRKREPSEPSTRLSTNIRDGPLRPPDLFPTLDAPPVTFLPSGWCPPSPTDTGGHRASPLYRPWSPFDEKNQARSNIGDDNSFASPPPRPPLFQSGLCEPYVPPAPLSKHAGESPPRPTSLGDAPRGRPRPSLLQNPGGAESFRPVRMSLLLEPWSPFDENGNDKTNNGMGDCVNNGSVDYAGANHVNTDHDGGTDGFEEDGEHVLDDPAH